ncbi:hypothetical protein GCM10027416_09900 [Okibacterium endophyticum]
MTGTAEVESYLAGIAHPIRQRDARRLVDLMSRVTGLSPRMWGTIVAFGSYHYAYATGREGDAPAAGFSARKAATTIYLPNGTAAYTSELTTLGAHTTGVGCLYIKDLDAVDITILEAIVADSFSVVTAGTFGSRASESQ